MLYTLSIVAGTVICGCFNSLLTKFQDNQCVVNCDNPDPSQHKLFEQPAIQTLQMFIGELGLYLVFYAAYKAPWVKQSQYAPIGNETQNSRSRSLLLAIPSICDLISTTFMNVGLVYVPVSIYQMTRGAVVLFVAILSVLFLKRRIKKLEWISLVIVSLGIVIVGYSGSSNSGAKEDPALIVFGMSLIIGAVALQAVQFVVEEKILGHYQFTPLKLVYTEGFFGVVILVLAMIILNFVVGQLQPPAQFQDSPFNLKESLSQTFSSKAVLLSSIMIMICISCFNFCGVSLTHQLSATARSTIDSCRTLLVWLVAMVLGWESFHLLQCIGFMTLVFGTLCFNGVLRPEEWSWVPDWLKDDFDERLIDVVDEPLDRS